MLRAVLHIRMVRALRHRNFRLLWFAGIGDFSGQGMAQFIFAWLVLVLTDGSLFHLGVMVFVHGLAMMGLSLIGGVVADRMDRRKVLMAIQLTLIANLLVVATLTVPDLIQVWHLYLASVVTGTSWAFNHPARLALLRVFVDRADVLNAVALNYALMNITMIVGPPVAGAIIEWVGIGPALYVSVFAYMLGFSSLLFIQGTTGLSDVGRASMGRDLLEGLRYVRSSPAVFSILALGFAVTFFGSTYNSLLPAFAREVLGAGAARAGLLPMAVRTGALTGNLTLALLGDFRRKNLLWLGTGLLFIVTLFFYAITPWFGVSITVLFFVGMGDLTFMSLGVVLLQLLVPPALLGRVMSVWMLGGALMFIGALPMGLVGDVVGLRGAIAGGAVVCLAFFLWLGVVKPSIRQASPQ